jgi:hypothetical protein
MTRRSSVRAQAQEIYREKAARADANAATPLPNPPPQGGRERAENGEGAAPDLTARVRALYEMSAVPVREIAALCGVAERTVYKYAAKHRWKPRYRWLAPAQAGTQRGRSWQPAEGFAAAKGAGGRFIRGDDKDKPFAQGLKATDGQGRSRAVVACRRASGLARAAQAAAEAAQRWEARIRAMAAVNRAQAELRGYLKARAGKRPVWPARHGDLAERALGFALALAVSRWEALQAAEERRPPRAG